MEKNHLAAKEDMREQNRLKREMFNEENTKLESEQPQLETNRTDADKKLDSNKGQLKEISLQNEVIKSSIDLTMRRTQEMRGEINKLETEIKNNTVSISQNREDIKFKDEQISDNKKTIVEELDDKLEKARKHEKELNDRILELQQELL